LFCSIVGWVEATKPNRPVPVSQARCLCHD